MTVAVHRAADRATTVHGGTTTRHAFSAGRHYDPANTSFGGLVLHDEHLLAPGAGFDLHRHRDLDVVTWVLQGELRHEDSSGATAVVRPGTVQVLRAGSGVDHAERNAGTTPLRFVQAWVLPDELGTAAAYAVAPVELPTGALVPVASGRTPSAVLALGRRDATLHVGRLATGQSVHLPDAHAVHLHVAVGDVALEPAGHLAMGDAVRLTGEGAHRVTATTDAELLVWELGG